LKKEPAAKKLGKSYLGQKLLGTERAQKEENPKVNETQSFCPKDHQKEEPHLLDSKKKERGGKGEKAFSR